MHAKSTAMNENPYMTLAKVILPKEMTTYFDLTKVRTDEYNGEPRILEQAYSIAHSLRMIFSNPRATWISGYESIQKWYEKAKALGNDSFNTAADTIRDREDEVLNYFLNRATNASAESLNSKIKQFRAQLRGVIDVDFFLYRLSMIYG